MVHDRCPTLLTEFGTALTTILPNLFQYCYKYCYSDSWNVMFNSRDFLRVEYYTIINLVRVRYDGLSTRERLWHNLSRGDKPSNLILTRFIIVLLHRIITKLPNSEQSSKGKVKTHTYIQRFSRHIKLEMFFPNYLKSSNQSSSSSFLRINFQLWNTSGYMSE
jgi:hypothetical protein